MKNHYELLGVEPTAALEEIKRAYRREIALYHPDKVQHLGREFQELATVRAAQLTTAYRVLSDERQRADYDDRLHKGLLNPTVVNRPVTPEAPAPAPATTAVAEERPPDPEPSAASSESEKRHRASGDDFVRKAAVSRFREAVLQAVGSCDVLSVRGFDLGYASRSSKGLFKRVEPVRVLGRFVRHVDAAAIQETWPLAAKTGADPKAPTCVFLMGAGLAPQQEVAGAISELRRRHARTNGHAVVLIPIDIRDWEALLPTDAPSACRTILEHLRASG